MFPAVSGLETLSPDQRAVLQLILMQGRGYADLAATLKLDPAAVRERAHAGASALGLPSADAIDAGTRGRIVDYLLGQQDDGERIVTFAELGDSPDACRWAQALRERLAGVAREELPEVPATPAPAVASANGSAAHASAATAVAAPPAVAPAVAPPASPPPIEPARAHGSGGSRPSRLGGAILIAGAAALAIVLAIVLIGGGSDSGKSSGTKAQTSAQAQTTATTPRTTTTGASRAPAARPVAAAVLRSPSGGSAIGAGLVQQASDGSRLLAVEAGKLAANGANDYYAIWLQGAAGTRFMGFVPSKVGSDGTFTVSAPLARGLTLASYPTLLVTRETTTSGTAPTTPGTVVLGGALRSTG